MLSIGDDERHSMRPQSPCALRVTGGAGPSAALPLLDDGAHRRRRGAPAAPVTRPSPLLRQAPSEAPPQTDEIWPGVQHGGKTRRCPAQGKTRENTETLSRQGDSELLLLRKE